LDALQIILKKGKLLPQDIERIEIHSFELASILGRKDAEEMLAAKFSVPYSLAIFILKGSCSKEHYDEAILKDDEVRRLAQEIEIKEEKSFTERFPRERPSRVTVYLKNGQRITETVFYSKGDAEEPYSEEELLHKFLRLSSPILGEKRAMDLALNIGRIEELHNIKRLLS